MISKDTKLNFKVKNTPFLAHMNNPYFGTIENISKRRTLRVLTHNNSFNYFVYKWGEGGFEYEMALSFVNFLNGVDL